MKLGYKLLFIFATFIAVTVPSSSRADDFSEAEDLKNEFNKNVSDQYIAEPKMKHIARIWDPVSRITEGNSFTPQLAEKPVVIEFGDEKKLNFSSNVVFVKHEALSLDSYFKCRITISGEKMICKSPCGRYYRIFQQGSNPKEEAALGE